jgi:arabinose-5-phosphate isomerase
MTAVVDQDGRLSGIFTDGDLRRVLDRRIDVHTTTVGAVMTANPRSVVPDMLAVEALEMLQQHRISQLPVVDSDGRLVGAFNMHDLLRAGVV